MRKGQPADAENTKRKVVAEPTISPVPKKSPTSFLCTYSLQREKHSFGTEKSVGATVTYMLTLGTTKNEAT